MDLNDLKKEIPYQWKIQSTPKEWKTETSSQKKWSCVAYIDARDVMDLLDEVVWPENWQSEFYQVKNTMFCRLGIKLNDWWVYKCDAWSPPDENSWDDAVIKWEPSDAFKRSAVMWWIWRFLYSKEVVWISQSEYQANKYKLTEFCNRWNKSKTTKTVDTPTWWAKPKPLASPDEFCPECGEHCETKKGTTKEWRPYEMGNCNCGAKFFVNRKDLSDQPF